MSDGTKCEPHKESCDGEEVFGWNKQRVINEESVDKVQSEQELLIEDDAKLLVACKEGPFAY